MASPLSPRTLIGHFPEPQANRDSGQRKKPVPPSPVSLLSLGRGSHLPCGTCSSPVGGCGGGVTIATGKVPGHWFNGGSYSLLFLIVHFYCIFHDHLCPSCRRFSSLEVNFFPVTQIPLCMKSIIEYLPSSGTVPGLNNNLAFFLMRKLRCSWAQMPSREIHFQLR